MNRHLYGDMLPVHAVIPDCVEVIAGDLMFLLASGAPTVSHRYLNKDLRVRSGVTDYAYPMASGGTLASNISRTTFPFLGVALDDSPSGDTDTIAVATAGVFEFPQPARAGVTLGYAVHSIQPTGYSRTSRTTASFQAQLEQVSGGGTTIGWCMKTKASGGRTVECMLRTTFGPGGRITGTRV